MVTAIDIKCCGYICSTAIVEIPSMRESYKIQAEFDPPSRRPAINTDCSNLSFKFCKNNKLWTFLNYMNHMKDSLPSQYNTLTKRRTKRLILYFFFKFKVIWYMVGEFFLYVVFHSSCFLEDLSTIGHNRYYDFVTF